MDDMLGRQFARLRRLAGRAVRRLRGAGSVAVTKPSVGQPAASQALSVDTVDFVCNVCGHKNLGVPLVHVQNREFQSCAACRSSLRMRSVMYALSMELFGKALTLPEFPKDKQLAGLGMSDWEGYAGRLEQKLGYINTFYHIEPRLDITAPPSDWAGRQRFLISSDVFEHIPVFCLDQAFANSRQLLDDQGVFIFTVPYLKDGQTSEHFPNLHDFRIIETAGKRYLYNKTSSGNEEIFGDLVFHGGDGMTLEMRMFSEPDLLRHLKEAGFASVRIYTDQVPEFGIIWPMDWAVPIAARVAAA